MIDLHMHILPGIDDGAESWEEAVEMAVIAAESGVEGIVATPHGNISNLTIEDYMEVFCGFQGILRRERINLKLYTGMEVFMDFDVGKKLNKGDLIPINHTRYVLVEFDFEEDISIVNESLYKLKLAGYIPLIAHVERYQFVQKFPETVREWILCGYVIQVNKSSFLGLFGEREQETALLLLKWGLIHVVASDAHGCRYRTPSMERAKLLLLSFISESYWNLMVEENPRRIIYGKQIINWHGVSYKIIES